MLVSIIAWEWVTKYGQCRWRGIIYFPTDRRWFSLHQPTISRGSELGRVNDPAGSPRLHCSVSTRSALIGYYAIR